MRTQVPVAALARRQHGVVSQAQLRRLGLSKSAIGRRVAAGYLHPVHHRVYSVGHSLVSPHGRGMAAVLSCGDAAVLSHHSAAWLWGISAWLAQPVEVTATVPRHSRPDLRLHSARTLRSDDLAYEESIPVTAVPRTLLDLAAESERNLDWALPRAKRLGLLDLISIDAMLARSRGLRGVRRLRRRLVRYRRPEFTRSELERLFLEVVERAGLPRPSMNRFVSGFELDAYWPDLRFVVELDTYEHHGDEISFEKDRVRQEELKLAGIEMTRVTGPRLEREPGRVLARLRRLLDQRRREIELGV